MSIKKLSVNHDWRFWRGEAPSDRIDAVTRSNSLNPWDKYYNDSEWEAVALPHTVRNETLMCSGGRNYQGPAWYRKRFSINVQEAASDLFLEFEGAMQRIDVWLDGDALGCREGGFLPVGFDLTGKITANEEHVLAIRISNEDMTDVPPGKPQGALDFCYFGGLYRDAWLHMSSPLRFTSALHENGGFRVTYPHISRDKAEVRIRGEIVNHTVNAANAKIVLTLNDNDYSCADTCSLQSGTKATFDKTIVIGRPRLWSPDFPNLYTLTARLYDENDRLLDTYTERIGIRKIEFTTEGCFINGKRYFLDGANRHQEYPFVGFALTDALQYRDVQKLRRAGIICVRTAHYPQDSAFMDACDEYGILCVMPTPGWQIHPTSVRFDMLSYENTRRMIRRDRNRPSAALWEPILNETDYPEYFAKKQLEIVMEETEGEGWAACDNHYAYAAAYPVNYAHTSLSKPRFVREYGDAYIEQFGPMQTLRRVRRGENTGFYPGGEKAMIRMAEERFEARYQLYTDPALSGAAMWAGIDHNRGYEDNEACVGMLDFLRIPKFNYYLQAAQQSLAKAGPIVYIANYNTPESPTDITVYSNCEMVRLSRNGKAIATLTAEEGWRNTTILSKPRPGMPDGMFRPIDTGVVAEGTHPPFTFRNVPFEEGELTAEAIVSGRTVAVCTRRTPKAPVRILLKPDYEDSTNWTADGSDLLMVHAYIVDEKDTVVPVSGQKIHFTIEGHASIIGNGEPWVQSNPALVEAGATGILLQAGLTSGKVVLHAECEGLESASITLHTSPDEVDYVSGPMQTCTKKPVYECDSKERFSERQSLKLESFYRWDMASGKAAEASSCAEGFPASGAAQGHIGTPWQAMDTSLPQWWQCDMGEECLVYGTTLHFLQDGVWYDYDILVSNNGTDWEKAASGRASGQSLLPDRFKETKKIRYLRVVITSISGDVPAGLYLVEIHGDKSR